VLRLIVYDRTCRGRGFRPGLSHAWEAGTRLYRALGHTTAFRGVGSWSEAFAWLAEVGPGERIAEVQYWGHGKWGRALADREPLDEGSLVRDAALRPAIETVARRMAPDREGLWWFRTCETFGGQAGQAFATAWAETLGCRVAAHTFVIGALQSGLHSLLPGEPPSWSPQEGIAEGSPTAPKRALPSSVFAPHTISCLHTAVPSGY